MGCGGLTIATPQPIAPTGSNRPTRDVVLQATTFKSYVPTYHRTKREFQLSTDPAFTSIVFTSSPNSDQVSVSFRLNKATTYYWRCRDFTQVSGVKSPWSQTATFTTIPVRNIYLTYYSYDSRSTYEREQAETEEYTRIISYPWNDIERPYRFDDWRASTGGYYDPGDRMLVPYNASAISFNPTRVLITWTVTIRNPDNSSQYRTYRVQDGQTFTFPKYPFGSIASDAGDFLGYSSSSSASSASYQEGDTVTIYGNETFYTVIKPLTCIIKVHINNRGGYAHGRITSKKTFKAAVSAFNLDMFVISVWSLNGKEIGGIYGSLGHGNHRDPPAGVIWQCWGEDPRRDCWFDTLKFVTVKPSDNFKLDMTRVIQGTRDSSYWLTINGIEFKDVILENQGNGQIWIEDWTDRQ